MAVDIEKLVENIRNGKFSRKELENLRKNAESRNVEEVMSACDEMLSTLPKKGAGGSRKSQDEIAETRSGFVIMRSAYLSNGEMRKPELVAVAKELSSNGLVSDVSILKTQIKLYYKGRHFTAGKRPKKEIFWLSCLDETKITDKTVQCWGQLGKTKRGKYFSTYYIAVEVGNLSDLHTVLNCVAFT